MAQELLGLSEDQLLGKTAIDKEWHFFNADGTAMAIKDYPVNQVIAKRQPLRSLVAGVHRPNRELENDVWVLINANPVMVDGQIDQVIVTFVDITERKRAEEALQESERKYRNLYQYANVGLFETGMADAKIIACNQRYCDLAGFPTIDSAIGMDTLHLYTNPSDREEVKKILRDQGYIEDHELQLKNRLTGEVFWAEFSARTNPSRDIIEGTLIDISSRKRADEELMQLRNYLSSIINSMPSVLVGVDRDCNIIQWNHQAEQSTGVSFETARSRPLVEVFPRLMSKLEHIKTAIRDCRVLNDLKVPHHHKDEIRYEDVTIFPLVANGVEGAVIRVDDVTERARLEEMMIQSEKMLSVGGLAAGMAHEINNPLAGILQNVAVLNNRLLEDLPANQKAAEAAGTSMAAIRNYLELRKLPGMLADIHASGSMAANIVRNMLSFARKSENIISNHDLGSLMDQALELLKTDYDMKNRYDFKKITIVREYDEAAVPVPCESSKIQQVFMNILKNGAEAMAEVNDPPAPPGFVLRVKDDGVWVRVEIEDNGPGMAAKTRRRIFEPFFTTKPVGKGTGLGLSVSYFIITEEHGGEMSAHASEDLGTRLVIRLPKTGKT